MNYRILITVAAILFLSKAMGQNQLDIYFGPSYRIDSIAKLEGKQKMHRPPTIEMSQFNTQNPFFGYSPDAILNSPYYPYTKVRPLDKEITFFRDGGLIDLTTSYHYANDDSIVQVMIYDWEIGRHEMNINKRNELVKKSTLEEKDYEQQYEEVMKWATGHFGEPDIVDLGKEPKTTSTTVLGKIYTQTYYQKSATWDKKDFHVNVTYMEGAKRIRLNYYKKRST
jgi:hypothetical protein